MLFTGLDKDNQLQPINASYLYDELKETIEYYNHNLNNNAVMEIGMNRGGKIFIYVEFNNKDLQYTLTANDYYVELYNKLTDELLCVALAPHDERDIARIFISEIYSVLGV